jgi:hypothetical protein
MMDDRWDDEYDRHRTEQRQLSRRRRPTSPNRSGRPEDYDPGLHLRWPEAKKVEAEDYEDAHEPS